MDIKDIKGPLSYGFDFWPLLITIVVLALIIAAIYFFMRKRKNIGDSKDTVPDVPPYEAARRALDNLRIRGFGPVARAGEYYVLLSNIVRLYMQGRFNLPVTDMTTEEFLNNVRRENFLLPKHKEILQDFLKSCDMVKFAKHEPTLEQMQLSFDLADRVVEETKPMEKVNAVS